MYSWLWVALLCTANAIDFDDLAFTEDGAALQEAIHLGSQPVSLGEADVARASGATLETTPAPPKTSERRRRRRTGGGTSSRRRKRSPLMARMAKVEAQVKTLTAAVKKLADNGEGGGGDRPKPPDPAPGQKPSEHDSKPQVTACKGKDEGEWCEFASLKFKEPMDGKCVVSKRSEKKVMWCKAEKHVTPPKPDAPPGQPPSGSKPAGPDPLVTACKDKEESEKCKFAWRGKDLEGVCLEGKDKILYCKDKDKPEGSGRDGKGGGGNGGRQGKRRR